MGFNLTEFWANYWPAFFHVTEQAKESFDTADIGIPFPQMDVHLNK